MARLPKLQTYLDHLYALDFKEQPVSVEKFISDPYYLGGLTEGGKSIYPVWKRELTRGMRDDSKYLVVFTGSIGSGKTRAAILGTLYSAYRLMLLKNPWRYFNLAEGGKFLIASFQLTKTLSSSTSYQIFQNYLMTSPWFMERGVVRGSADKWLELPLFEWRLCSPYSSGFGTLGEDCVGGLIDELDSPTETKARKLKLVEAYFNTVVRFTSRFVDTTTSESLGKFFLVSSKQEEEAFLDAFIVEQRSVGNTYVVDIPIWEAKGEANYDGRTFPVMVGNAYTSSKILNSQEEVNQALQQSFRVLNVPEVYRIAFQQDINRSLRDLAGISISTQRRSKLFPAPQFLEDCYDRAKENPCQKTTLVIGLKDATARLIKHFDLTKVRIPRSVPRYIHGDIAYSGDGDAYGLAMSCCRDWVKSNVMNDNGEFEVRPVPLVETDFAVRIKSKKGDKVPLYKIRELIFDLRSAGFNIQKCTFDLRLASEDTKQLLGRRGITCDYISLDKKPEYYRQFRDLVTEQRWLCHKIEYLHFELINLEDDPRTNKIDHPDKVKTVIFMQDGSAKDVVVAGSKDLADATVGSVIAVLQDLKSPPDVQYLKSLLKKANSTIQQQGEKLWWLDRDVASVTEEPVDVAPPIQEVSTKMLKQLFGKVKQ